jgi:SagB-type dehydrogenase family enzyme
VAAKEKSLSNDDVQAAWHYHNGTKHLDGFLFDPSHDYDYSKRPLVFKIYKDLPAIPLDLDTSGSLPALEAVAGDAAAAAGPHALDVRALARLLHYSAGITKYLKYRVTSVRMPFRAAACTGALYHIELYVVCGDLPGDSTGSAAAPGPGLEAGVYHFDPQAFALRRLRQGDYRQVLIEASAGEPGVAHAPLTLVVTDVVWRNAVKYDVREYRHAFWDGGTLLANTFASAAAHGLPARLVLGFVDEQVSRLLALDAQKELVLALIPIGTVSGDPPPPAPPVTPLHLEIEPYSSRETEFPAIGAMHAASSLPNPPAVAAWRSSPLRPRQPQPSGALIALQPLDKSELPAGTLEQVIMRRGSPREFAREAISFGQLSTVLSLALRAQAADYGGEPLNDAYLIVNAVDGLAPGAYVYHPSYHALELLKPGDFRAEAGELALQQDLAADASVAVFFLADLAPILASLGNRGYRAAQFDAGLAGGRLYLAAYALGFGASGLTFQDDEVTRFFSPHAQGKSVMFLVALGRKLKRPQPHAA